MLINLFYLTKKTVDKPRLENLIKGLNEGFKYKENYYDLKDPQNPNFSLISLY